MVAAARALTRTAQDAQAKVRSQLPERFTIRTRWVEKGIRIRAATKGRMESVVWVKDAFMTLHETGGSRKARSGKSVAIPIGARPRPKSVTRPSKFPAKLLTKPKHFIAPFARGSSQKAVWKRTTRKMKLMYLFADMVHVKPGFGFQETVKKVVHDRFAINFQHSFQRAMNTAR